MPHDWTPNPPFAKNITDSDLNKFALSLNYLWQKLGRKLSDDVALHPHRYSILPMAHPFVVPGGRFREFYYVSLFFLRLIFVVGYLLDRQGPIGVKHERNHQECFIEYVG